MTADDSPRLGLPGYAVLVAGLLLFMLFGWWVTTVSAGSAGALRATTADRATRALAEAGIGWSRVAIQDDKACVNGVAPDDASRNSALNAAVAALQPVTGLPGIVQQVNDCATTAPPAPVAAMTGRPRDADGNGAAARVQDPTASRPQPGDAPDCFDRYRRALGRGPVQFGANEFALDQTATSKVAAFAELARACPSYRLVVEGHANDSADGESNRKLSQQRAQSVVAVLTNGGVSRGQIVARAYGDSRPLIRGGDAANRYNSRVEISVER